MGDRKTGASNSSDTAFRKTWDRDEYADKAVESDRKHKEEGKARHEAAAAGKKFIRRASTPPDVRETEARKARLNVTEMVGKTMLVPAGAGNSKRGRGAGFYCDTCDLTFKDNLQFIDHLNSKQHLVVSGESGEVKRATLKDVQDRFAWLKRKRDEAAERDATDLETRLAVAKETGEAEREEKRRLRREKRRKTKDGLGVPDVKIEDTGFIC